VSYVARRPFTEQNGPFVAEYTPGQTIPEADLASWPSGALSNRLTSGDMAETSTTFPQTLTLSLTDAQIKALPSTVVEVLPAPGLGMAVVPQMILLKKRWLAGYGGLDDVFDQLCLGYGATTEAVVAQAVGVVVNAESPSELYLKTFMTLYLTTAAMLPAGVASFKHNANWGGLVNFFPQFDVENQPLCLAISPGDFATDNLSGGDPGNRLDVTVVYFLLPV
jgi:hypothetical protein